MKKTVARVLAVTALAAVALAGAAAPALAAEAQDGGVAVVDEPDTSNLNNIYTFAPLGVPVLGLARSLNAVPGKILPSFGS